jgi:hypothetical protein
MVHLCRLLRCAFLSFHARRWVRDVGSRQGEFEILHGLDVGEAFLSYARKEFGPDGGMLVSQ